MSRHRHVRNRTDSYEDVGAGSEPEEEPLTAAQEAYMAPPSSSRSQSISLFDFAKPSKKKGKGKRGNGRRVTATKRNPEQDLLDRTVPEVIAVLGSDAFPRSSIESALRKANFKVDIAIDRLLSDKPVVAEAAADPPASDPATFTMSPLAVSQSSPAPSEIGTPAKLAMTRSVSSASTPGVRGGGRSIRRQKQAEALLAAEEQRAEEDGRGSLNLVVVGHVDAGKSTLMGQTLVSLGLVSKQRLHGLERDAQASGKGSFALAWVMDEHSGERERGVTIDVGVNTFRTPSKDVTLLDAPGHKDFVPNMITGAAQADAAVLVVAAQTGEFESGFSDGGQTKEHAGLVKSLGIHQLIVAVNKMDLVGWAEGRFEEVKAVLTDFLVLWGFKPNKIVFVPCAGFTGDNITRPCESDAASWYQGPTLVDAIDAMVPSGRPTGKPLRAIVSDVYSSTVMGTTLACKLETGFVVVKDKIVIMPGSIEGTVRTILRSGDTTEIARAGDNVEIGVADADISSLSVGQVVCHPQFPVPVTNRFKATLQVFPGASVPIIKGSGFILHHQSVNEPAVVTRILERTDPVTGKMKKKPRVVSGGQTAVVHIRTPRQLCLEDFASMKRMGRFLLRYRGETIAAGKIIELRESKQ